MRAPVINRFAKIIPLAAVAALTAGLTVIPASTAWACGDEPAPAELNRFFDATNSLVAPVPTAITPGGPKVELGMQLVNSTGAPFKRIAPKLTFDSTYAEAGAALRIEDVTVELMRGGEWKPVKLRSSCDPLLWAETDALVNDALPEGGSQRYLFRVGLSAKVSEKQRSFTVGGGLDAKGHSVSTVLNVTRPTPAPKPGTPKATPSAPAAVPGVAKDAPTATPTP
ncbi:hypothetical protein, partial [Kitasatospora nipponensis]|uniref:hypothetical protein n=1 Tax=Kitasatospora nipponensis TaxID=258049 RepID=UPI0031DFCBA2